MSGRPYSLTILDSCNDLTGWSINETAGGKVTLDTVNTRHGGASIKLTAPTSGDAAHITKAIPVPFAADDRIGYVLYVRNKTNVGNMGASVRFGTVAAYHSSGFRAWRSINNTNPFNELYGWQLYPIEFDDLAQDGGAGAPTKNMAYISKRLQIAGGSAQYREINFDAIVRYRSKPTLIITNDDGGVSAYTEGFSYADAAGVPMTFYIMPGVHEAAPGFYMSRAQVLELIANGQDVQGHGQDPWDENLPRMAQDIEQLRQEFGLPMRHVAYPLGRYGEELGDPFTFGGTQPSVAAMCEQLGIVSGRITRRGLIFPGVNEPYFLPVGANLTAGTSLANVQAVINRTIKHGLTCILYSHVFADEAASSTWAIADWQALIDWVVPLRRQGLLDIMTIDQWMATPSRPAALERPST